jgi:hypothetical protein
MGRYSEAEPLYGRASEILLKRLGHCIGICTFCLSICA